MDIDRPTFAALRGGVDAQHDATTLPDAAAPRSSNAHRGATQLQCAPSSLMLLQSGAVRECTDAWDLESHSAQGGINSAPFPDRAVRGAAVHPLLSSAPHARDDTGVTLLAQSWETCRAAGGASGGEGDASWRSAASGKSPTMTTTVRGGRASAGLASKKRKSAAGDKPRHRFWRARRRRDRGRGGCTSRTLGLVRPLRRSWYRDRGRGAAAPLRSRSCCGSSGATSPLPLRFGGTREAQERGGGSSGSGS